MSPFTLGLVLASAVIHATWNLWAKQIGGVRGAPLIWSLTAVSALAYAPFALWAMRSGGVRLDAAGLFLIVGSGVLHVIYFALLLRGYRHGDLSLVYPIARGTGPLLAALGAILLLGERATPLSVGGALLIAAGVLILTWRPGSVREGKLSAGVSYGLATGVLIGIYLLWDGWAVKRAALAPLVYYWGGELVRVVLLTPAALANRAGVRELWRGHRARVLGIALLSPLSYLLLLVAFQHGNVSHLAPAREVSIVIGAWLGGQVLGEGDRRRRVVAAVAFAAGVAALALA